MIDTNEIGMIVGIVKQIPGTATKDATDAADRAESAKSAAENAAELAATRNYGVSVTGSTLAFTANTTN